MPSLRMRIRSSLRRDAIAVDSSVEPSSSSSSSKSVNVCVSIERNARSSVRAPLQHGNNTDTRGTFIVGVSLMDTSQTHPAIRNQVALLIMSGGSEPLSWRHHPLSGAAAEPCSPPAQGAVGNDLAVTRRHKPEIFMRFVRTMNVDDRRAQVQL